MTPPRTQSKKTSRAVSLSRAFVPLLLTISTPIARPRPRVSPTIERSSHSFTRFRAFPPIRAARSGIRSRRMISIVTVAATQAAGCPPKVVPATTSSFPIDRSSPSTAARGIRPPPSALPTETRSGATPKCSIPHIFPVRPSPASTSSAMKNHPCSSARFMKTREGPDLRLEARLQEGAEIVRDRLRLLLLVVVRDQDALRAREDTPAPFLLDFVGERERRVANLRRPDRHLNLIAPRRLGLEVDVHVREDEVDLVERPPVRVVHVELRPRQLDVGEINGVVDVTHAVDVAEPHLDVRGEARHRRSMPDATEKRLGSRSLLADETREFRGEFERDLLRRIALDRGPRGQALLRELAVNRP